MKAKTILHRFWKVAAVTTLTIVGAFLYGAMWMADSDLNPWSLLGMFALSAICASAAHVLAPALWAISPRWRKPLAALFALGGMLNVIIGAFYSHRFSQFVAALAAFAIFAILLVLLGAPPKESQLNQQKS